MSDTDLQLFQIFMAFVGILWIYMIYRLIKKTGQSNPILWTIGMFIPILNLILVFKLAFGDWPIEDYIKQLEEQVRDHNAKKELEKIKEKGGERK